MTALLQVSGLRVSYPGRVLGERYKAVRGVSFHLDPGEILGLVGESGCGKSTVAKAILGLVPIEDGWVQVGDVRYPDGGRQALSALRSEIQMVFQDALLSLNPRHSVGFILREALRLGRRAGEDAAIQEGLDEVGLDPDALERFPHELSGGQRQRVMIARALLSGAGVLVADEPVSALDLSIQAQVLELIRRLNSMKNLACVFISHDLDVVRYLCSRVAVMLGGLIVEDGPVAEVLRAPAHPYTRLLLASVPHHMTSLEGDATGQEGDERAAAPERGCPFQDRCTLVDMRCRNELPPLIKTKAGTRSACFKNPSDI